MASIDNRVVNLEFDNASFGKKVDSTLQSLTQLHEGINKSVGDIDLSGIESGVSNISSKFSALGAIGFTAIQNLTNSAIDFGQKIAGSVLDPLVEGGKRRALNIEQALDALSRGKTMQVKKEDIIMRAKASYVKDFFQVKLRTEKNVDNKSLENDSN